jgi:pyridoxine 4-dehydrogenase
MSTQKNRFKFPGTNLEVARIGYGAMQLAGPHVWGPPKDRNAAVRVLRDAISMGVDHIDTSDYYGPHVTNQIIKEALHPYPKNLVITTKVGNRRAPDQSWPPALSKEELVSAVHDNLKNLGLDSLHVVNLRVGDRAGPNENSIEEPLQVLIGLQKEGLIQHIGVSNVSPVQIRQARAMTNIVCVQNQYNIALRKDDALIDDLAKDGGAYVPFFPLGGFEPLQSSALENVAKDLGKTPMQIALAWLLHRSPNILLIPGTSSSAHLRENMEASEIHLPESALKVLNAIRQKDS